jgi:isoquinoline 1-oxidoreductase beta subunit
LRSLGRDDVKSGVEAPAVDGFVDLPYETEALNVDCVLKNTNIPVSYWRSVGASQNAFAQECFIDELAAAVAADPYRFRRKLLAGKADFLHVLDIAAEKSGWGSTLPKGKGRGMSIYQSCGTIAAQVIEVSVPDNGDVRVERVVTVIDCGHVVNALIAEMQVESAVVFGLSAALFQEITFKNGRIEQRNFDDYRMLTLADTPIIETHFALSGGERWGGLGEPGTPPIAPALCNAIFAATGVRIRRLPVIRTPLSRRSA